jgi:hypothetical protein
MTFNDEERGIEHGRWCKTCSNQKTHNQEWYGPLSILCRMQPETIEGRVYKGYCLSCHDVYALRQLLGDPTITLNLLRYEHSSNSISSLQLLRQIPETDASVFTAPGRKRSPIGRIFASLQFQITCGVIVLAIVVICVGLGVFLSKRSEPWTPPPPPPTPATTTTNTTPYVYTHIVAMDSCRNNHKEQCCYTI